MPFTKTGPNSYTSPSGRHWTQKQVNLYYATDGFTKAAEKVKKKHSRKKK